MNLLTLARDLRRRKARERNGLFVAEGLRAVEELLRSSLDTRGVLVSSQLSETSRGQALIAQVGTRGVPSQTVKEKEFATAAETDSPQGVLAIATIPSTTLETMAVPKTCRILVLDAIQDPGNAGTIVRTAAALNATATFSLPGTVDLWNAKVVRSGMGAHFHHPCLAGTWDEFDAFRAAHSVTVWAADAKGDAIDAVARPARLALVVGNEGAGLSVESRSRADMLVSLPIAESTESLNVAVAAGILLYELRR